MQTTAILDRAYSFSLLGFLSEAERQKRGIDLRLIDAPELKATVNAINNAAILYDKILIERSYSTGLEKLLESSSYEWFHELFEPFDLQNAALKTDDELAASDDLALDLNDAGFVKLAEDYYVKEGSKHPNPASAITYVGQLVKAAKARRADIIPWPTRYPLFEYKFSRTPVHFVADKFEILDVIFDVEVPDFDLHNISEVLSIRKRTDVASFRSLVWDVRAALCGDGTDSGSREEILKSFIEKQRELIDALSPTYVDRAKMVVSWAIPFPFNAAIDGVYELSKLAQLEPYRWAFFLKDLRKTK